MILKTVVSVDCEEVAQSASELALQLRMLSAVLRWDAPKYACGPLARAYQKAQHDLIACVRCLLRV